MKTRSTGKSILVLLLGPVLASVWWAAGPPAAAALDVGDRAPDFSLPSTTGANVSLGQFREKKMVLLEFYAADFRPV